MKAISITATGLALVALAVAAQDRVLIKVAFPKEAIKYKSVIKTDMDVMGTSMSNTITTSQTVTATAPADGWAAVTFRTDEFKMEGDGMMGMDSSFAGMKDVLIKMDVDESGRTRNIKLEGDEKLDPMTRQMVTGSMKSDQMAGFMGVHFPKEAIGVGSKWSIELDAATMFDQNEMVKSVTGKLPVSYEVVGFETINGKNNVRVKSNMAGTLNMSLAGPAGDMSAVVKMNFNNEYWVDVASGMLTKSLGNATIDNDFGMGQMAQKLNIKVDRVP